MNKKVKFIKMTQIYFFAVDRKKTMSSILENNSGFNGKDDGFICLYK